MIVILSQDPDAVRDISRNQANASQAIFGPSRQAFVPMPPLGPKEDLFIVAKEAKRGPNFTPVVGDERIDTYWNAVDVMRIFDRVIPTNYSGNIYVAACDPADPKSSVTFASTFKEQLLSTRKNTGKAFGHASAALGPIPPPGDRRWIEAVATRA